MVLGIFWDIENVDIPKLLAPSYICNAIRNLEFASNCHEEKFIVACNARKLDSSTCRSLIKQGVTIYHVETAKNAADDLLIERMIDFINNQQCNELIKIILITGDKDFGPFLQSIQEFHTNVKVLLIHPKVYSRSLTPLVHESLSFEGNIKKENEYSLVSLPITNLPNKMEEKKYKINTETILKNMLKSYEEGYLLLPAQEKFHIILPKQNANLFRKKYANFSIGPRKIQILEYMDDLVMIVCNEKSDYGKSFRKLKFM